MNIFILDTDPTKCAEYHCDKHLVKMITEHNQILGSIAYTARGVPRKKDITEKFINENFQGFPRSKDGNPHPYGIGYRNHPCTRWAAESLANYMWLCILTAKMCKEYTKRYGRTHAGEAICLWYYLNRPNLPMKPDMSPFVQAMPADVKNEDPVKAYRDYYMKYKRSFARWKHSEVPTWFTTNVSH